MTITYPPEMLPTPDEGESGIVVCGDTIMLKADALREIVEAARLAGWNAAMASENPELREHFPDWQKDEEAYAANVITSTLGKNNE